MLLVVANPDYLPGASQKEGVLSKKNGTGPSEYTGKGESEAAWQPGRVPPPNARTIKDAATVGRISPEAARAAAEAVSRERR